MNWFDSLPDPEEPPPFFEDVIDIEEGNPTWVISSLVPIDCLEWDEVGE